LWYYFFEIKKKTRYKKVKKTAKNKGKRGLKRDKNSGILQIDIYS